MITKQEMSDKLYYSTMCEAQHGGYPCNSCFHSMEDEWKLKKDIHEYWLAVLAFRGDYPDLPKRNDLIEELYNTI